MKQMLAILLLTCFSVGIAAQNNDTTIVATTTRDFMDPGRSNWPGTGPRPMRCIIWYPAAIKGTHSLIVLSHGSGGSASQMKWLGNYLASKNFITVSINHNGTAEEERQPPGGLTLSDYCIWERPADISRVLDKMLTDSIFAAHIDTNRIGAAGFSLGGASVIWAAGAVFNRDSLVKNGTPPPESLRESINKQIELTKHDPIVLKSTERMTNSYKDPRIKAVFALGPAIGQGFPASGLINITIPVMIVVGDADLIAPMAKNAAHFAAHIKGAVLKIIPGEGGHYLKPANGNEYEIQLEQVSEMANLFFHEKMKIK